MCCQGACLCARPLAQRPGSEIRVSVQPLCAGPGGPPLSVLFPCSVWFRADSQGRKRPHLRGQVLLAVPSACFSSSLAGICRRGQQPQERQPLQMTLVLWRPRPLSSVLSLLFRPRSSWPKGRSSCHEVTPAGLSTHLLEVFVALNGVETLQRGCSLAPRKARFIAS